MQSLQLKDIADSKPYTLYDAGTQQFTRPRNNANSFSYLFQQCTTTYKTGMRINLKFLTTYHAQLYNNSIVLTIAANYATPTAQYQHLYNNNVKM